MARSFGSSRGRRRSAHSMSFFLVRGSLGIRGRPKVPSVPRVRSPEGGWVPRATRWKACPHADRGLKEVRMRDVLIRSGRGGWFAASALVAGVLLLTSATAYANVPIKGVSRDPYTAANAYHGTQVEADTYSHGSTIESIFQSGRFSDGGADNVGWARSGDGGVTWTHGFFPSTTVFATPPGPYKRATDPAITYDAKHSTWVAVILVSLAGSGFTGNAVIVSLSTNGGASFTGPFSVATIAKHTPAGGIRSLDVLGADVDAAGKVYDVWYDCSFRAGCTTNDIVMSTSSNGTTWTAPVRIPIDVV